MGAPKTEAEKEMGDVVEFMSSFFNLTRMYFYDGGGNFPGKNELRARPAIFKRMVLVPPFENIGEFGANYPEVTSFYLQQQKRLMFGHFPKPLSLFSVLLFV